MSYLDNRLVNGQPEIVMGSPHPQWMKSLSVRLVEHGWKPCEVANVLGVAQKSVYRWIKGRGLTKRKVHLEPPQIHELVVRYQEGATTKELGADYAISTSAVLRHVRQAGITVRKKQKEKASHTEISLYQAGMPLAEISRRTGRCRSGILQRLQRAGVYRYRKNPTLGETYGADILRLRSDGLSMGVIADQLGISLPTVSCFLSKRSGP